MNVEALSTPRGYAFARKFLNSHKALFSIIQGGLFKDLRINSLKELVDIGEMSQEEFEQKRK